MLQPQVRVGIYVGVLRYKCFSILPIDHNASAFAVEISIRHFGPVRNGIWPLSLILDEAQCLLRVDRMQE